MSFLPGSESDYSAILNIASRDRWMGRIVQVSFNTLKTLQLRDPEVLAQDSSEEHTNAAVAEMPATLAFVCDVRQPVIWKAGSAERVFDLKAKYSEINLAYLSTDAPSCPCVLELCTLLHPEELDAGTKHDCPLSKLKVDLFECAGLNPRTICTVDGLDDEETSTPKEEYLFTVSLEQLHALQLARCILSRRTRLAHTESGGWEAAPNVKSPDVPDVNRRIEALVQQLHCPVHDRSLYMEPHQIPLPFSWRGPVVADLQLATTDTLHRLTFKASQLLAQVSHEEELAYNTTFPSITDVPCASVSHMSASSHAPSTCSTSVDPKVVNCLILLVDKAEMLDLLDQPDTISLSSTHRLLRNRLVNVVFPTRLCLSVDDTHAIPAAQMKRLSTLVRLLESDQQRDQRLCHALEMSICIDTLASEPAVTPYSQWLPVIVALVQALACDPILIHVKRALHHAVTEALRIALTPSDRARIPRHSLALDTGKGQRVADWVRGRRFKAQILPIDDPTEMEKLWSSYSTATANTTDSPSSSSSINGASPASSS